MKLVHLSDLHLGKRVNGFSMIDDQRYIIRQILEIIDRENPEAVLIAGDVYDRPIPSEEAVDLFDDFLVRLSKRNLDVLVISGNHDSAERVSFGGRLMDQSGIHIAPVYNGQIEPVVLTDEYGPVYFWLFPFLKPALVNRFFSDQNIVSYTDAMQVAVEQADISEDNRNVALVHQFITGGSISDSEEHSVGGVEEISGEVLRGFDYVALGHLHGPQRVGRDSVRYCGSPLKYSFSEASQKKCVTVVELGEKGEVNICDIPLAPMRDMVRIEGAFSRLMEKKEADEDYYEITLTDEEDIPNAIARLRTCYPNLMTLRYDNTRTRTQSNIIGASDAASKSPMTLFDELYEMQNGVPMSEEQREYVDRLIREIWEDMK